jgi:hypothetical protein
MRADRLLLEFLGDHIASVHSARVRALLAAVAALIRGGDLAVSRLGRAIAGPCKVKHGIKRVDRLYGNRHLRLDRLAFYRGIAHGVIRTNVRPVITIDWTEAGEKMCTLAAAVPASGRATTIYAETHPLSRYTSPRVEAAFLRSLKTLLPHGCRPIVITDAGFRAPWLRKIVAIGWDYIGRIRGRAYVRPAEGGKWVQFHELYLKARRAATDLGRWSVTRYKPYEARLVLIRQRRRRWVRGEWRRALDAGVRGEVEAAKEPWLLATSIEDKTAHEIAELYGRRMQIEETFRDTKSRRFGWALETARTKKASRTDVMLLVAALASLLVLMVGIAAEGARLHLAFQANTIRRRRVLALTTLGRLVLLHAASVENRFEFRLPEELGRG